MLWIFCWGKIQFCVILITNPSLPCRHPYGCVTHSFPKNVCWNELLSSGVLRNPGAFPFLGDLFWLCWPFFGVLHCRYRYVAKFFKVQGALPRSGGMLWLDCIFHHLFQLTFVGEDCVRSQKKKSALEARQIL